MLTRKQNKAHASKAIKDGQLALNQTIRVGAVPTRRTNFCCGSHTLIRVQRMSNVVVNHNSLSSPSPSLVWHLVWGQEQRQFKSDRGDHFEIHAATNQNSSVK